MNKGTGAGNSSGPRDPACIHVTGGIPPGATPFDDAFKTEVAKLREFLVPLINEIYGTDYDVSLIQVERIANEHYVTSGIQSDGTGIPKRLSDSCIKIDDKLYHVECQSTPDGDILIRLVEYNMQIGLENLLWDEGKEKLSVELPRSSLLMLRSGSPGSEKKSTMTIVYRQGEKELSTEVPVLHVQAYTPEEIYEKKLYFLIPFYSIRFEKSFDRIARNGLEQDPEYDRIYHELDDWFGRLKSAYENHEITEEEGRRLAELSRLIMNHLMRKMRHELGERLVNTVGGKVLELECDRIYAQGHAEGKAEGKAVGVAEGEDLLAALLQKLTPGSDEYREALTGSHAVREELYRKYGLNEK